ncbi:MAG: protein-disulfide reductase DsbD N-terminal domain-containing protein [Acidobacteria bacterium]|nr:protein-disulfide reductase DsbD N-terminal domain-containing protein [Acidobacteriota bacterium]
MAGLILLLAVLFIAPSARTQAPLEDPPEGVETGATPDPAQNQNPVSVSAKIDQSQLKSGQTAKLLITAKLEPGWHLYALTQPAPPRAAKVTIDESGVFKLDGAARQPKPKIYKDPNFSEPDKPFMSQAFENEVTFAAPIKVASDAIGSAALPLYAIISPDEKTLAVFPSLTRDKQGFIGFLQRGAGRFEQQTARR